LNGNETPPGLAQAYERYKPLLIAAIGAMARKGTRIPLADGIELVDDFFIEALDGLLVRYDPSQSRFSCYLYRAFRRFARRRMDPIVRRNELLVPVEEAEEEPAVDPADTARIEDDAQRLDEALERLPPPLRKVLEARLDGCPSERDIAQLLGLTRHVVRQRLAEAVGRLIVAMEQDERIDAGLRPFAVRLWRDGITLMQVAKEMMLSRQEAWRRYRKLLRSLATASAALVDVSPSRRRANNGSQD